MADESMKLGDVVMVDHVSEPEACDPALVDRVGQTGKVVGEDWPYGEQHDDRMLVVEFSDGGRESFFPDELEKQAEPAAPPS